MEKFVFFRHRHLSEYKELIKCFKTEKEVSDFTLKNLRQTQEFDFKQKNLTKLQTTMHTPIEDGLYVNSLEMFVLDGNKVIAYQNYFFDNLKLCSIMYIETRPSYRRKGIAQELLTQAEDILFNKLDLKLIESTATNYSKNMFKKRGYSITPLQKPEFIMSAMNPSVVEVVLTKQMYLQRPTEKERE